MTNSIRLCLVLHNHQPVGNFDGVFEQAYQDSYKPFLDVFESYGPELKISLHTSGPLMDWLDERHPEYVDRVARLVAAGRVEIVGGPYYEPILPMIPSRDRIGQITSYTQWLESRLGATVNGMWMPERVWEQSLASDLASAGMKYTVLDDSHFRNAGLADDQLLGHYITEDDGKLLSIFPGSEPLRYFIPFQAPDATVNYLREIADKHPNSVVVFGDDGEKFGTWPDTKKHVYDNGWLRQFFDSLVANKDWVNITTLTESIENVPPVGKIYLPDASYREMTEWALPVTQQEEYDHIVAEMQNDARWPRIKRFVQGGFWRNFKVKYPETNEMYARMMMASKRVAQAERDGVTGDTFRHARQALYRGQCNCPYWHGAFGGIYLPHLRNAIFNQLIACDNLLDQAMGKTGAWVEATVDDYNFDARQEVRLASDKLICLLAPASGGQMYELDVRTICHNLLATLTRRPEAYHRKVLAGQNKTIAPEDSVTEHHTTKSAGLAEKLQYDQWQRKSLLDHFFDLGATREAAARGEAAELGDFISGAYETKIRRASDKIQVQLTRSGNACGHEIKITKAVTMAAGSSSLEVVYLLENLPPEKVLHFGVELNFAGLPSGADDRYFHDLSGQKLGQLGTHLDLHEAVSLGLVDEWLGIDVQIQSSRPTSFWTFPIETVSQSEGGYESVHQSVCVVPHWMVKADSAGRWTATFHINASTKLAESRMASSNGHVAAHV